MILDVPESELRKCRYCGDYFLPRSPAQEVCKKEKCQKQRNRDKANAYHKKVK